MSLKSIAKGLLASILRGRGLEITETALLYEWQRNIPERCPAPSSALPSGATEYLSFANPRFTELKKRYDAFDSQVVVPFRWTNDHLTADDLMYFRGDNPYVWQLRGPNMNEMAYALTYYYLKSIDTHGVLNDLTEDMDFGNITFLVDDKVISRDLIDSINELYFLEKHLNVLSSEKKLTVLDIGAGYGRLAHRMTEACPMISDYMCTDGVAASTFISEYYLKYRHSNARVIPLDEIEREVSSKEIDLAVNIHSFSECTHDAIEWWMSLLSRASVKHIMIVPNSLSTEGNELLTNDGKSFYQIVEKAGYQLLAKDAKYNDPIVQKYGINPTHYFLFKLTGEH